MIITLLQNYYKYHGFFDLNVVYLDYFSHPHQPEREKKKIQITDVRRFYETTIQQSV